MLSIILPTFNEEGNIGEMLTLIKKNLQKINYEVIVIDDNSSDKPVEIAKSMSKKLNVRVIVRKKDYGLSQSVVEGFRKANGDIVCAMDSDLQHPVEILPKMLDNIKNCDIVIGSRFVAGGEIEKWSFHRKIISFFAKMMIMPLTKVHDPMTGFFMVRKSVIKFDLLKPRGYKILLEILVRNNLKNFIEVPIVFRDRIKGKSKLSMKVNFEYIKQVFSLYLFYFKNLF